jgi:CubicO group peptidase (beta-lactamase class C family)
MRLLSRSTSLLAALGAGLIAPLAACSRPAATTDDPAARVARVTASLSPAVAVEGRPATAWPLAERMAQYKVPGVSIAVIDSGRIAWAQGFGVKEAGGNDSITATTLFQAASISKPVAATATLRLVEQGKLDLDADVNRYLTSWKVPDNRFTQREKVTLRRIVSHNAGLTVHGFPGYEVGTPVPTVVQVLNGEKPANTAPVRVDTFPGAIGRYSGGGITIEQLLLGDVTHQPFPQMMRELVLEPAGMTHSTYEQPLPSAREAEAAHAHDRDGHVIPGRWHVYPEMAAAGLWTTPSDLLHWALAIDSARTGEQSRLLSKNMATQMLTEQKDHFGLGPSVEGTGRAFRYGHGGANEGFHSQLIYFPETRQGAAVMTNGDGGPPLIQEIIRAIATEYRWPALGPEQVASVTLDGTAMDGLVGEYALDLGGDAMTVRIRRDDARLLLDAPPLLQGEELVPTSPTTLVTAGAGWRLVVTRDASGRATSFTLSPGGQTLTAKRKG